MIDLGFDFHEFFDNFRELISTDTVDVPGAIEGALGNYHDLYGDMPVDVAFMHSPQGHELLERITAELDAKKEAVEAGFNNYFDNSLDSFIQNAEMPDEQTFTGSEVLDQPSQTVINDPSVVIDSHVEVPSSDMPDNHDDPVIDDQQEGKDISFTGATKCTLCSCGHYVGGDSMEDVCVCGHKKWQHVWA